MGVSPRSIENLRFGKSAQFDHSGEAIMRAFWKKLLRWDEPMGLNVVAGIGLGAFVFEAPPPKLRRFFFYLSWYHLTVWITCLATGVVQVWVSEDFFSQCLNTIHCSFTGMHLMCKYITMKVKEKQFLELFTQINTVWKEYEVNNREFLSKTLSSVNKTTVLIFMGISSILFVGIVSACIKNMSDPEHNHLPVQFWIPAYIKDNHLYIGFLLQFLLFSTPLLVMCMATSFLNSISAIVEALGLALAEDIRRQKVWNSKEAKSIYVKHQTVIRIVGRVNSLMAWNWGLELICASVQLTLPAYSTLRAFNKNDKAWLEQAFVLAINTLTSFLVFFSGNRILSMGERIRDQFWETNWHDSPLEDRKNILFMLTRAGQPIEYRYKMIHFDLEGFTTVVNSVFSYMALLQFFDAKIHVGE